MRRMLEATLRRLVAWARLGRSGREAAAAEARPDDAAFLNEVSETLRRIETSDVPAAPPRPAPAMARLEAAVAWLRRLRQAVSRHEDALLAAILLLGILVMVIHWSLGGSVHAFRPAPHPRRGAEAASTGPTGPVDAEPARPPEARAGGLDATGASGVVR